MSNTRDFASRVPVDGALSNRNLLINGDFSVWQRGNSHSTGGYGSVDRWTQHFAGAQTITRLAMNQTRANEIKAACGHVPENFVSYNVTSFSSYSGFRTRIEDIMKVSGQTLTFSAVVASENGASVYPKFRVYNTSGGISQDIHNSSVTTDGVMRRYTWTFNVADVFTVGSTPDGSGFFEVEFYTDRSGWHDYACFQLEVGDTATPFEHEPYSVTLQKCQRFYYLPTACQGGNVAINTDVVCATYPFPVRMRATPTSSGTSSTMSLNYPFELGGVTGQYHGVEQKSVDGAIINYSSLSATSVAGRAIAITGNDVQFDAEL